MRARLFLTLALGVGALCAGFACVPGGPWCTEIGCASGLFVTIATSDGTFPAGEHTVEVLLDDRTQRCTFTVLQDGGDISPSVRCDPDILVQIAPKTNCVETRTATSVRRNCTPIDGLFIEKLSIRHTPTFVRVVQRLGDVVLLDARLAPTYQMTQPNGPMCEPVCRQAHHRLAMSLPSELSCESQDQCVHSLFTLPVGSIDDCYCLACGDVLPTRQARTYQQQWNDVCTTWAKTKKCLSPPCDAPGAVICDQQRCKEKATPQL